MIPALATILAFQLGGEAISRGLGLPVPGPVIGMIALVGAMTAAPRLGTMLTPAAQGILGNLTLFFVPAGVGVIAHAGVLRDAGPALALALVVSTIAAIAAGALAFAAVARLTGGSEG
ncbi:MAG: CidA/LrgA family protein [Gemmobacter sp.]